jgi:hypothetical protein
MFHNPSALLTEHKPAKRSCSWHSLSPYAVHNIHVFSVDISQLCTKFDVDILFNSEASHSAVKHDAQSMSMWNNTIPSGLSLLAVTVTVQCIYSGPLQNYTKAARFCFNSISSLSCNNACNFAQTMSFQCDPVTICQMPNKVRSIADSKQYFVKIKGTFKFWNVSMYALNKCNKKFYYISEFT